MFTPAKRLCTSLYKKAGPLLSQHSQPKNSNKSHRVCRFAAVVVPRRERSRVQHTHTHTPRNTAPPSRFLPPPRRIGMGANHCCLGCVGRAAAPCAPPSCFRNLHVDAWAALMRRVALHALHRSTALPTPGRSAALPGASSSVTFAKQTIGNLRIASTERTFTHMATFRNASVTIADPVPRFECSALAPAASHHKCLSQRQRHSNRGVHGAPRHNCIGVPPRFPFF